MTAILKTEICEMLRQWAFAFYASMGFTGHFFKVHYDSFCPFLGYRIIILNQQPFIVDSIVAQQSKNRQRK